MRILGIDPGSIVTGFGILERDGSRLRHVAHGTLRPPRSASPAVRLAALHAGLAEVISSHAPDVAAVERVFVSASPRSALVLGEARGALLTALGASGIVVREYAAREVKKAVVGIGSAEKRQVQAMVRRLLSLSAMPAVDAADALAVAVCHAHAGCRSTPASPGRGGRGRGRPRTGRLLVRRAP